MSNDNEVNVLKELTTEITTLIAVLQVQSKPVTYLPHELEYFTIEEVSGVLNCSKHTVRNILKENEVKIFQYKGLVRVRKTHLERFLNKHTI